MVFLQVNPLAAMFHAKPIDRKPISKEEIIPICPTQTLDPDDLDDQTYRDACWDPDDPTTWEYFLDDPSCPRYVFFPNRLPLIPGEEIFAFPVFELYFIEIVKLDPRRNFSMISMCSSATGFVPMIIYKRPEGEEITFNRPLPLKGPLLPPDPESDVILALSNPVNGGWGWGHDRLYPAKYNTPILKNIVDKATDSVALISYELITLAAKPELVFHFLAAEEGGEEEERPVQILSGYIFATNDGNAYTKRLIKNFTSHEPPVVLKSKSALPVDRCVFGVPMGSNLKVTVDHLEYIVGGVRESIMNEFLTFHVPTKSSCEELFFPSVKGTTKLRLRVSWSDAEP